MLLRTEDKGWWHRSRKKTSAESQARDGRDKQIKSNAEGKSGRSESRISVIVQ